MVLRHKFSYIMGEHGDGFATKVDASRLDGVGALARCPAHRMGSLDGPTFPRLLPNPQKPAVRNPRSFASLHHDRGPVWLAWGTVRLQ